MIETEEEVMVLIKAMMVATKVLNDTLNEEPDAEIKELIQNDLRVMDRMLTKVIPNYKEML